MKKFSVLVAFVFAVMFSSTALAANWVDVCSVENEGPILTVISVDQNSVRRGIQSQQYDFSTDEGFSAVVKLDTSGKDIETGNDVDVQMFFLVAFYEDEGVKKYCVLDTLDENGNVMEEEVYDAKENEVDEVWSKVWDFVAANLK